MTMLSGLLLALLAIDPPEMFSSFSPSAEAHRLVFHHRLNLTISPVEHTASSRRFADCSAGVQDPSRKVCCNAACGLCGGHGCSGRPGGPRQCCVPAILRTGRVCESRADVACILRGSSNYVRGDGVEHHGNSGAVLAAAGGDSTPPARTQPASLAILAAAGGESMQPASLAPMKLHPRLPPIGVTRAPHVGVANATAATVLFTSPSTESNGSTEQLPLSPPPRLGRTPPPPPPTVRQSAATPQPDDPPPLGFVYPNIMRLFVITPVFERPANLRVIGQSLNFTYVASWIVVLGGVTPPRGWQADVPASKLQIVSAPRDRTSGNVLRNIGAQLVPDDAYIYFLDDDNTMRSSFWAVIPYIESGRFPFMFFDQCRAMRNGKTLFEVSCRRGHIDTGSMLFQKRVFTNWTHHYDADGRFALTACKKNSSYKIPGVLANYNSLRPNFPRQCKESRTGPLESADSTRASSSERTNHVREQAENVGHQLWWHQRREHLLAVTFATQPIEAFCVFARSAIQNHVPLHVLGWGRGKMSYNDAITSKIGAMSSHLRGRESDDPNDVILFADGYDALFLLPVDEIRRNYDMVKKGQPGVVVSAVCNNSPICLPGYPASDTAMRYINTGNYMGTTAAIDSLMTDMQRVLMTAEDECPVRRRHKRMCFNDQYAAGRLFLSNRDKYNMSLDTEARLFVPTWMCPDNPNPCGNATVAFDPEKLMQTVDGRLHMVDLKRTAGEFRGDDVLVTTPSIVHFNGGRQKAKQKTFLDRRKITFAHKLSTFPVYIDKIGFKTYPELGCQATPDDPWPLEAPVPSQPIDARPLPSSRGTRAG